MLTIDDLMPLPPGIELTQDTTEPATWHLYVNGRYSGPTTLEKVQDDLEVGRAVAPILAEGVRLFEVTMLPEASTPAGQFVGERGPEPWDLSKSLAENLAYRPSAY